MGVLAKLTVTTGPDRGKSFELQDDLVHIGRGTENQIVLTDPGLDELQVSIANRNGRFAIYTPIREGIAVEGNDVPPEHWYWLPEDAQIQISRRTALHFQAEPVDGNGTPSAAETPTVSRAVETTQKTVPSFPKTPKMRPAVADGTGSVADLPRPQRKAAAADGETNKRTQVLARFITDGPGDPLVKLGEDGHLPELQLDEGLAREVRDAKPKQTSPWLLVAIFLFSVLFSVGMLFLDMDQSSSTAEQKAQARQQIVEYYGSEGTELKPYQSHLREARQARSRGDFGTERKEYRIVLELLRAEGKNKFSGLTGTTEKDEKLEQLISTLLRE